MTAPLTVTQLCGILKDSLEEMFPRVAVVGELTGVSRPSSGHIYFTMKDAACQLPCTCWSSTAKRLKFAPANGQQVVARGRITHYGPQAKTQLSVDSLEPVGVGAAELAKKQLLEKLRAKGYFEDERKRRLPVYPKRIGIVSSATGAVVRDMLELLSQRWPLCEVVVQHSRVQGEGAPQELAAAVTLFSKLHTSKQLRLDAVIIGRGGGSTEDLLAFDAEIVADAIFKSPVPVISAVGHETDVSIADLVADVRAETPSAAVMALTPNRAELMSALEAVPMRMRESLANKLLNAKRRLDLIAGRPAFTRPLDRIRNNEQRLDTMTERMQQAMTRRIQTGDRRVTALASRLESLSPLGVLKRGYSLTRNADGTVLRSADTVAIGDEIVTTLANGELRATVTKLTS
ncbi:exodeoxyribonuclease VII large subunit [soil metagenome]